MVMRRGLLSVAGAALLANAAFAAGPIPTLPANLPGSTDAMAAAAASDPAAYRDVLLNCAAAQGVVAMVKNKAGMSSTGHDQMAILLIHVAGTLPPADEWAASQAYGDKLFAFDRALQNDKTGTVQFDLLKLTQSCAVVEQYADATAAKEQAASPAGAEPANPMFDDKQREDIINELMGIKADDAEALPEAASEIDPAFANEPSPYMLDSEKAIVAGIFADHTSAATGYRGMLLDCATYHSIRWESAKKKDKASEKAKEEMFLQAVKMFAPESFGYAEKDHAENIARYKDALANDKSGETKKEIAGMAKTCAAMEPAAQERIDLK